jgi:hypothetical protein
MLTKLCAGAQDNPLIVRSLRTLPYASERFVRDPFVEVARSLESCHSHIPRITPYPRMTTTRKSGSACRCVALHCVKLLRRMSNIDIGHGHSVNQSVAKSEQRYNKYSEKPHYPRMTTTRKSGSACRCVALHCVSEISFLEFMRLSCMKPIISLPSFVQVHRITP